MLALEELGGPEDCAEHVAAQVHGVVDLLPIDDSEEDEVGVDFIDFACDFTEDVCHYP